MERQQEKWARRSKRTLKRVGYDGEVSVSVMSKLKPLVLKKPPSMSRIVPVPLWMTAKVQSCVIAALLQRNEPSFSLSPFFPLCLSAMCPLIFPKLIMRLVSLKIDSAPL